MCRKIILFEANEIPVRIFDDFISSNNNSTLAKIIPQSKQYITVSKDKSELSPWITWPTLHRGVNDEEHRIFDFGQNLSAVDKSFPPIWDILVKEDIPVGVFGPLHSSPLPQNHDKYKFFVPDTFAKSSECFPSNIEIFQKFNLSMARKSSYNVSKSIDIANLYNLIKNIYSLGIRGKTILSILNQLIDEIVFDWKKNRRRTYQPVLAFDIYLKLLKNTKPHFTNFFTNHVASSMHRFWAAKYPNDYNNFDLEPDWVDKYKFEIDFSMVWLDKMINDLVNYVNKNDEYVLIISTSMGQDSTTAKKIKSQLQLRNPELFFKFLGLEFSDWHNEPAMDPQYNVKIKSDKISIISNSLENFYINEQPLSFVQDSKGFFSLNFGHSDIDSEKDFASINGERILLKNIGLKSVTPDIGIGNSAYHIPEGSLFIYDSKANNSMINNRLKIDTRELAPAILKNFDVKVPSYMLETDNLSFG